ncbi:unnamed protein product, partial [Rotaria sp. Silwood1]
IAIDWIVQNLYVNDLIYGCIWVLKNDESYVTKLKQILDQHSNLVEHESALQCHCVHGECVYHVDEDAGYEDEYCDEPTCKPSISSHILKIVITALVSLLLIGIFTFGLIQLKRKEN